MKMWDSLSLYILLEFGVLKFTYHCLQKHDDTKVYASSENLSKPGIEGLGAYNLSLSDLGKIVLQNEVLCQQVVTTLLEVLVWPDSPTSARASYLLELVLPVISSNENLLSEQAVRIIFTILRALHTMGQHEPNYIALIQVRVKQGWQTFMSSFVLIYLDRQ